MTWFAARNISVSTVPVVPADVWTLITSPDALAALTPLVKSIEAVGAHWRWTLSGIDGLGIAIAPVFTERMEFVDRRRIVFAHEPPPGDRERAAVEGRYDLVPIGDTATELTVDLTLSIDLPLPRLSAVAVERIMRTTMSATGQRFAANMYDRLGLDPADVAIDELPVGN